MVFKLLWGGAQTNSPLIPGAEKNTAFRSHCSLSIDKYNMVLLIPDWLGREKQQCSQFFFFFTENAFHIFTLENPKL